MTINATLIIQMIHFLIAYMLFDRLLLRSVVALIEVQEDQDRARTEQLSQELAKKEALLKDRADRQAEYKKTFCCLAPDVQAVPVVYATTESKKFTTTLDRAAVGKTEADLVQVVTDACSSVRS